MTQDGVIYTDGREVTITPFQFIIGRTEYLLEGITKIRFLTLRARRAAPIVLLLLGIVLTILGAMYKITPGTLSVNMGAFAPADAIIFYIGIILLILGLIWLLRIHDRYSVRITTAEGDKDAIISDNRDYIQQIIDALREAMGGYQNRDKVIG